MTAPSGDRAMDVERLTVMRRLTKPQIAILAEIASKPQRIAPTYPPVRRLAADGLIVGHKGLWGSWTWSATDAGRAALASQEMPDGR